MLWSFPKHLTGVLKLKKLRNFFNEIIADAMMYEDNMRRLFSKEAFEGFKEALKECDLTTIILIIGGLMTILTMIGLVIASRLS